MDTSVAYGVVEKANQGVDALLVDEFLAQSGLSRSELGQLLGIDPKTLDNYRKQNKSLDRLRSELLLKLINLFSLGREVFGDSSEFRAWLQLPAGEFNGDSPIQLLTTVTGVTMVARQLERISQGYVV